MSARARVRGKPRTVFSSWTPSARALDFAQPSCPGSSRPPRPLGRSRRCGVSGARGARHRRRRRRQPMCPAAVRQAVAAARRRAGRTRRGPRATAICSPAHEIGVFETGRATLGPPGATAGTRSRTRSGRRWLLRVRGPRPAPSVVREARSAAVRLGRATPSCGSWTRSSGPAPIATSAKLGLCSLVVLAPCQGCHPRDVASARGQPSEPTRSDSRPRG
jgi:hypothetical protein